jgi:hypothetical protein
VSNRRERRRAARAATKVERPHQHQRRTQPPDWWRSAVSAFTRGLTGSTWHYHDESSSPQAIECVHLENVPRNYPDTIISLVHTVCRECGAVSGAALDEALEANVRGRQWWWAGAGPPVIIATGGEPDDLILESHCPIPEHQPRDPVTLGEVEKQRQRMLRAGKATRPLKLPV